MGDVGFQLFFVIVLLFVRVRCSEIRVWICCFGIWGFGVVFNKSTSLDSQIFGLPVSQVSSYIRLLGSWVDGETQAEQ